MIIHPKTDISKIKHFVAFSVCYFSHLVRLGISASTIRKFGPQRCRSFDACGGLCYVNVIKPHDLSPDNDRNDATTKSWPEPYITNLILRERQEKYLSEENVFFVDVRQIYSGQVPFDQDWTLTNHSKNLSCHCLLYTSLFTKKNGRSI